MRDDPRSGSLRGVPGGGSLRGGPGMGSMRGSSNAPDPNARQAQAGTQTGSGTFTKTMAINALGRESEAWEKGIEQSGHPVKLQAPDLSGYIVSRIGTPKAASRRTVRIPVRATHMDTLVPQDFIIDVEFRGGVGSSRTRAVSARRTPVKQERSIPVSWFVATVGFLMVAVLVLWFVIYLKG